MSITIKNGPKRGSRQIDTNGFELNMDNVISAIEHALFGEATASLKRGRPGNVIIISKERGSHIGIDEIGELAIQIIIDFVDGDGIKAATHKAIVAARSTAAGNPPLKQPEDSTAAKISKQALDGAGNGIRAISRTERIVLHAEGVLGDDDDITVTVDYGENMRAVFSRRTGSKSLTDA